MRAKLLILPLLVLLVGGCASGKVTRIENSSQGTPQESALTAQQDEDLEPNPSQEAIDQELVEQSIGNLKIGDSYIDENFSITLNEIRAQKSSEYFTPDNDVWLILNFTIENTSNEIMNISSLLNFEVQGSDYYRYSVTILGPDLKGSIEGEILPYSKVRG